MMTIYAGLSGAFSKPVSDYAEQPRRLPIRRHHAAHAPSQPRHCRKRHRDNERESCQGSAETNPGRESPCPMQSAECRVQSAECRVQLGTIVSHETGLTPEGRNSVLPLIWKPPESLEKIGGRTRTRTLDPLIKRHRTLDTVKTQGAAKRRKNGSLLRVLKKRSCNVTQRAARITFSNDSGLTPENGISGCRRGQVPKIRAGLHQMRCNRCIRCNTHIYYIDFIGFFTPQTDTPHQFERCIRCDRCTGGAA